jgi:hypothetical protein
MRKIISIVVSVSLLFSQPASATFFSDVLGFFFTVGTYPIQLILGSTKAPFFKKQNPLIEKDWEIEAREKIIYEKIKGIVVNENPIADTVETIEEKKDDVNPLLKITAWEVASQIIFQIFLHANLTNGHLTMVSLTLAAATVAHEYYQVYDGTKDFETNFETFLKVSVNFFKKKIVSDFVAKSYMNIPYILNFNWIFNNIMQGILKVCSGIFVYKLESPKIRQPLFSWQSLNKVFNLENLQRLYAHIGRADFILQPAA